MKYMPCSKTYLPSWCCMKHQFRSHTLPFIWYEWTNEDDERVICFVREANNKSVASHNNTPEAVYDIPQQFG